MENLSEEKNIALVVKRVKIADDIYAFIPDSVVEGNIDDFNLDEDNSEKYNTSMFSDGCLYYYLIDNIDQIYGDNEIKTVIDITSKEDLLKEFDTDDIVEAKQNFYEASWGRIVLGTVDTENNVIRRIDFNCEFPKKIIDNYDNCEFEEKDQTIFQISKDLIKKMLEKDNIDEIKEILNQILSLDSEEEVEEVNKSQFQRLDLDKLKETLKEENNLEFFHKICDGLSTYYLELSFEYDAKQDENRLFKTYSERCVYYAEKYSDLSKEQNLSKVKDGMNRLLEIQLKYYKKQQEEVQNIVKDEPNKKEELKASEYFKDLQNEETEEEKISKLKAEIEGLRDYLDSHVIGQNEAKKSVISAIVTNNLITNNRFKNSCLLVGPTGSGKTLIVESIGEYYKKPIEIIDTTQLTVPGYVGANIEDFLVELVNKCNGDIKLAEQAIVCFDEIDKKGSQSNSDISGKGVLNTLLPFIGGTTYNLDMGAGYRPRYITFDTSNLTVFATGAFTDALESEDNFKKPIGFGSVKEEKKVDIKYKKVTREDLEKKGHLPIELLGRFTTIAELEGHTIESLKAILTSENSPLNEEIEVFKKLGVTLSYEESYLDAICNKALSLKTGARSLKTILEENIRGYKLEVLFNMGKYDEIILNGECIDNPKKATIIDRVDNNQLVLKR